jgi:hypothetical protein
VFTAPSIMKLPSPSSITFASVHALLIPLKQTIPSPSCTRQNEGTYSLRRDSDEVNYKCATHPQALV